MGWNDLSRMFLYSLSRSFAFYVDYKDEGSFHMLKIIFRISVVFVYEGFFVKLLSCIHFNMSFLTVLTNNLRQFLKS